MAAVSYDTSAILQDFTARHNVAFPLLADPDSEIIRAYGVLNGKATGFSKGMAVPGYFYIGPDGLIREKYFETDYTDLYTANNILLKIFPQLVEGTGRVVASPSILLTLLQSDRAVIPGSRFTLTAEVDLPPNAHVYAPGVRSYKPIQMILDPIPELKLEAPQYPKSKVLFLPAIQESVPVFDGKFRISEDAVVSAGDEFVASLGAGRTVSFMERCAIKCVTATRVTCQRRLRSCGRCRWRRWTGSGRRKRSGTSRVRCGYRGGAVWECDAAGIVIAWEWWGAGFPGFSDRAIEGALA